MDIIPQTDKQGVNQIAALIRLAEAFMEQMKLADAKECCEIVCGILEKRKNGFYDGLGYMLCSSMYEDMNEPETAISLMQKALVIIEAQDGFPASMINPLLERNSAILARLFISTGNMEEVVLDLEVEVQTKGNKFGLKSFEVGLLYSELGTAYFAIKKPQRAVQTYVSAKYILDECLGLHHMDSINICKSRCWTYEAMGSYSLAIPMLEEVIRRLELLGRLEVSGAQVDMDEALRIMAKFMEKAGLLVTNNFPAINLKDKMLIIDVLESLSGFPSDSASTTRHFGIYRITGVRSIH